MKIKRIHIYNIILTSIIFVVLYWKRIFGGMTLFYNDIGVDTINIIYPVHKFILSHFKNLFDYSFQLGFGGNVYYRCISIINPINFISVLMGEGNLSNYYLIASYVCIILCSFIGYNIASKYTKEEWIALVGGLTWAFSGWIVLWGQQLSFMIAYTFFSIYFCALIRFESNNWRKWLFLVLSLVLLVFCGYYWLYMAGVFGSIYIIGKAFLEKNSFRKVLIEEMNLLLCGLFAIAISSFKLLPDLQVFFNSSRSGNLSNSSSVGILYSLDYLLTDLARVFSNNSLGYADSYSGSYNYYEGTILWVTQLGMFAIVFWLLRRDNGRINKRKFVVFGLLILSLVCPIVTHLITFDETKQRWTYMLIMLQIVLIVCMFSKMQQCKKEYIKKTVLYSLAIYSVILGILLLANHFQVITIQKAVIKISVLFIILYALLLLFGSNINKKIRVFVWVFVIMCNLIVENYATYNNRMIISQEEFENSYYNDGTEEAVEYIKSIDTGLFRIQKDYMSVFLNDPLVQGYNGVTEYNETEPDSVAKFMNYNSIPFNRDAEYSKASKYINLTKDNYYISTMLGVNYLLSKEDKEIDNYTFIKKIGGIYIYQNENDLSFGYIYENIIENDSYKNLSQAEKDAVLTSGFYLTDENENLETNTFATVDITNIQATEQINALMTNKITNVSYADNVFKADANNTLGKTGMLCIPIFYDSSWNAYIDGEKVEIHNINGGLVGIIVEPGEHEIVLEYDNKCIQIGIGVSVFGIFLFILLLLYVNKKNMKGQKGNKQYEK